MEDLLDVGELLVGVGDVGSDERVLGEVGAQDGEAVERCLLVDLGLLAPVVEAIVGNLELEVLLELALADHLPGRERDLRRAAERPLLDPLY